MRVHVVQATDESLQDCIWQSIGQTLVLHGLVCSRVGQDRPPYTTETLTVRMRCVVPPPQSAVHGSQPCHEATSQFVGQAVLLQKPVSAGTSHVLPP